MKTSYLFGAALAASVLTGVVDQADAVGATAAAFTFETSGVVLSSTTATGATFGLPADVGVGSMIVSHGGSFGVNATYTSPIGNGSPRGFLSKNWSAGDSYVFNVSTEGLTGIKISFDLTADDIGPKMFGVQFNRNSGNAAGYTSIVGYDANFTGSSTGFGTSSNSAFTFSFDFSAFTNIENNSLASFRLQNLDSSHNRSQGGVSFIDNFVVTGTAIPEPASMGLALVAVGSLLSRRSRS